LSASRCEDRISVNRRCTRKLHCITTPMLQSRSGNVFTNKFRRAKQRPIPRWRAVLSQGQPFAGNAKLCDWRRYQTWVSLIERRLPGERVMVDASHTRKEHKATRPLVSLWAAGAICLLGAGPTSGGEKSAQQMQFFESK